MINKMTKYDFVLLSGDAEAFLSKIQGLGVVDVTRSSKPVDSISAEMLARAEEMKKAMAMLSELSFEGVSPVPAETDNPAGLALEQRGLLDSLGQKLSDQEKEKAQRLPWGKFDKASLDGLSQLGYTVRFFSCPLKAFKAEWASEVALQEVSRDERNVYFVVVAAKDEKVALSGATELAAPSGTASDSDVSIAQTKKETEEVKAVLMGLKERIPEIRAEYATLASSLDRRLAEEHSRKEVEDRVCIMEGFAPDEDVPSLDAMLENEPVVVLKDEARIEDNPPIKLRNNKYTEMFRTLTDMYGRPDYNEFDPTPYISIFFTLFFAFCIGDMGYGVVILLGGLLMKKMKGMADSAPLVMTLGVATMLVGFFFHTFFSCDISKWGFIQNLGLDKIMVPGEQVVVPGMGSFDWNMLLALACGVLHLSVAFVVKAVYTTKKNGFANSLGTWGWTLLLVGSAVVGGFALAGVIDKSATKFVLIVLGIISAIGIFFLNDIHKFPLLNVGTGLWETYNTATGLLGDVLSYLRLYALGLAGGMLGAAFNDIATMVLGDGGPINWLFFILIAIVGHTLNIAMAALGAFVHPLRLNFLEFFKNSAYDGMGRTYKPLTNNNQ